MEKYGFIYIWFDVKHKKYYVGSHWGTIDDGYVCSSSWMKQAYKRRMHDFKRRIIKKVYERSNLLKEEQVYLNMIKDHELKNRYYNLTNKIRGHWATESDNVLTVGQKISKSLTGRKLSVESLEKRKKTCEERNIKFDWNKGRIVPEEEKIRRRGKTAWNKNKIQGPHKNPRAPYSEEAKQSFRGPRGPEAALKAWETKRKKKELNDMHDETIEKN